MPSQFETPSGVRFRCSRCGDCCRNFEILLGPGEAESLATLDWSDKEPSLVGAETTTGAGIAGRKDLRRLARRDDGACIYLDEDQGCRIHHHFGGDAKPLMCRLYPFGFYAVGERTAVDVSFACRAVSEASGPSLERQVPEWTRWIEASPNAVAPLPQPRLDRHRKISADLLWELEHALLAFLERRGEPLLDRVRCMLQFVRVATTGDPTTATAASLRQAMAAGLPGQIARQPSEATCDKTQRAVFFQWLFLALDPVLEDPRQGTPAERRESARRHERASRGYLQRRGAPQVAGEPLDTTFEAIAQAEAGVLTEAVADETLATWLRAKIVGQRFLSAGGKDLPFIDAVRKLLVAYPMALWTAKALACHRGVGGPELGDLRAAIRRIDRTLGRVPVSRLPRKQAKVFDFILLETDLVEAAVNDVLAGR